MHFYPSWPEPEFFIYRENILCVENDCGNDLVSGCDRQPECSIVKTLERLRSSVACAFGVTTHVHSFREHFFHLFKTFPSAFLVLSVHQHGAFRIIKSKYWDFHKTILCYRFIRTWDERA